MAGRGVPRFHAPVLLILAAPAIASAAAHSAQSPPSLASPSGNTVTFTRDIAPILFQHCVVCHRPAGPAPLPLLTYRDAKDRAALIAAVTRTRRMPPWLPEPGRGRFAGERRLSDREVALIERWVAEGTPEGNPDHLPPLPNWEGGWYLGEPDLVVEMPEPYTVAPRSPEVFRNFVIPVPVSGTRYVRAAELHPGSPRVVHHAMLLADRTPVSRQLDANDSAPGYDGMHGGNAHIPEGVLLGWTPGQVPSEEPAGLGWHLDQRTDLVVQLHLRPGAQREIVQARVGLYFSEGPPTRVATTLRLGSETIDIPAGERRYVVEDTYRLPVDVQVLSVYPHAHYLAREMQAFAELADGRVEWLLHIRDWDFNWQDLYRYAEPVFLPKGSVIVMRYTYDNSAANPHNPNDPPRSVVYGPRSADEMGDLWVQVTPGGQAELALLKEDFAIKDLGRRIAGLKQMARLDPGHSYAQVELGNLFLRAGYMEAAAAAYRGHLASHPHDGNAHYNLGVALESLGPREEAIAHYEAAIRAIPNHAEAHFKLAAAHASRGEFHHAVAAAERALALASQAGAADLTREIHATLAVYRDRLRPVPPR